MTCTASVALALAVGVVFGAIGLALWWLRDQF
jgi:hypothetical protein